MIRTTITLTFELVTINAVPNIYVLGKSKHLIGEEGTSDTKLKFIDSKTPNIRKQTPSNTSLFTSFMK